MLVTVAEQKSIRLAAQYLHKTQPSITNALKKMESELNISLFDRSEYRIKLTDEGERIKAIAIQLLEKDTQVNELATQLSRGNEAFIKIAIEASFDLSEFTPTLHYLQEKHANCQIQLEQEYLSGAYEKLLNNQVDLAISPIDPSHITIGAVEFKAISQGGFVNLATPSLLTNHEELFQVAHLRNKYQIIVKDSGSLTEQKSIGVQPGQSVWYVNSFETKKLLIENGLGWGTLPKSRVTSQLASGKLIELKLKDFPLFDNITYQLIKLKNKELGPIASAIWQSFEG